MAITSVPNTTSTTGSAPKLPYKVDSLKAPLTASQRNGILKYLEKNGYSATEVYQYVTDVAGKFNAQPLTDNTWIDFYNTVAGGGGVSHNGPGQTNTTHNIPGISSTLDFLKDAWGTITSPGLWLRIGEGVLGLLLIGIGLAKLTGTSVPVASKLAELAV